MTRAEDEAWKADAPCREAESPALFDVPDKSDKAGWARLRATAHRFCKPCPLINRCAVDPAGSFGLWAGSARSRPAGVWEVEPLFEGAPVPPHIKQLAFAQFVPQSITRRQQGAA